MVYPYNTLQSVLVSGVIVQELLWFIFYLGFFVWFTFRVIVQELLWFIKFSFSLYRQIRSLSYKNCYGLSIFWVLFNCYIYCVIVQELLWFIQHCLMKDWSPRAVIVQELLWFIRARYTDHREKNAVIVQELLWFIMEK